MHTDQDPEDSRPIIAMFPEGTLDASLASSLMGDIFGASHQSEVLSIADASESVLVSSFLLQVASTRCAINDLESVALAQLFESIMPDYGELEFGDFFDIMSSLIPACREQECLAFYLQLFEEPSVKRKDAFIDIVLRLRWEAVKRTLRLVEGAASQPVIRPLLQKIEKMM